MKAIKFLVLFFIITLSYSQSLTFPILIKETDTLQINSRKATQNALWIQSLDSEILQRHKITQLESRLLKLSDISDQIDYNTNGLINDNRFIVDEYKLRLDQSQATIDNLTIIVQNQTLKLDNKDIEIDKEKRRKNFWRTTTLGVGVVTITTIVVKALL